MSATFAVPRPVRIAVVSGSRADYGLLLPLLRRLEDDPRIDLALVVCAAHLAPEFGLTRRDIIADGFAIAEEIDMLVSGDSASAVTKSVGLGCIGFAQSFARLRPDALVLLGDRFETLAAAQAAMLARIPVAHLHGGESTEGAIDESIRHAVTKMARVHFVAAEPFRERVLQLGEDPEWIRVVGAIGLDNIAAQVPLSHSEIEERIGSPLPGRPLLLVTYHPETLGVLSATAAVDALFTALDEQRGATVVMTYANSDSGGRAINAAIEARARDCAGGFVARPSLGQELYLNLMRVCDAVVGNSSSGLIEAPSFGVPTVNIGARQDGRLRADSVIDCAADGDSIAAALRTALSAEFRARARGVRNPYGDGHTAPRISEVLATTAWHEFGTKRFHAYPGSESRSIRCSPEGGDSP